MASGRRRIICRMQTLPGISSGDQGGDDIACTGQEIGRACLLARLMTVTRFFECVAILEAVI